MNLWQMTRQSNRTRVLTTALAVNDGLQAAARDERLRACLPLFQIDHHAPAMASIECFASPADKETHHEHIDPNGY